MRGRRRKRSLTDEQRAAMRDIETCEIRLSVITAGLAKKIEQVECQGDWDALQPIIQIDLFHALNAFESAESRYDSALDERSNPAVGVEGQQQ